MIATAISVTPRETLNTMTIDKVAAVATKS